MKSIKSNQSTLKLLLTSLLSITLLASFAGVRAMDNGQNTPKINNNTAIIYPNGTTYLGKEEVVFIKALLFALSNKNNPLSQNLNTAIQNFATELDISMEELNTTLDNFNNLNLMHQIANTNSGQVTLGNNFTDIEGEYLLLTASVAYHPEISTICNAIINAQNNNNENQNNQE